MNTTKPTDARLLASHLAATRPGEFEVMRTPDVADATDMLADGRKRGHRWAVALVGGTYIVLDLHAATEAGAL